MYVGIGRSSKFVADISEASCTEEVVQATTTATGIDVFLDLTAKQCNICCAIDVATERYCCVTQTATIDIALYDGPLFDDDVCVVFLTVKLCCCLVIQFRTVIDVVMSQVFL